jgi:hypothetical protein
MFKNISSEPAMKVKKERNPPSVLQKAGWAKGSVWTGAEILALIGIRSPDGFGSSESLYWLSYPSKN